MKKFNWLLIFSVASAIIFSGCADTFGMTKKQEAPKPEKVKTVVVEKPAPVVKKKEAPGIQKALDQEKLIFPNKTIVAVGEGIAPLNTVSPAQATALAKRAAVADAYRQMGAKLYGVKVNAKDTVRDAALKNSNIVTQVNALVKNANITETEYSDGLYRVTMELNLDGKTWEKIFSY